jgi:ankyrin repeat protein
MWAALYGTPDIMEILLDEEVVLDAKDKNGRTTLIWASSVAGQKL